jgi:methylmalonyl-CoA/ethylmalonyl-CoA epimerase
VTALLDDLRFHHVGVACRSIASIEAPYRMMGYEAEADDFEDPIQGVRGRFMVHPAAPRLELLEPLEGSTVLDGWLTGPTRMYHLAFGSADLGADLDRLKAQRGRVVVAPTPAVAFDGRSIAFVLLPNSALIELIEA